MSLLPISVVINTKNADATLEKALRSVKDFATQIIVMDMQSTDKTRQIAEKFTKEVYKTEKDFEYVEPARNLALSKVKEEWVFILDADEEVSPELKNEIQKVLDSNSTADCFFIPRRNVIFEKEMAGTGWWPDYQMRLFRKGKVEWSNQIHSVPQIHGTVAHFPANSQAAIIHQNFQKVDQFVQRLNRYTTIEAVTSEPSSHITSAAAFKKYADELIRRLFAQKGIDEGLHGLSLSLLQASYQLVVELKKWERSGFSQTKNDQESVISELKQFESDLNYWIADWKVQHSSGLSKIGWQFRRKLKW